MRKYIPAFFTFLLTATLPLKEAQATTNAGQILIHIKLSNDNFGETSETFDLYPLEDDIEQAIGETAAFDGHEIGGGYFVIRLHADDVKTALDRAKDTLASHEFRPKSFIQVIYTDERAERIDFPLP